MDRRRGGAGRQSNLGIIHSKPFKQNEIHNGSDDKASVGLIRSGSLDDWSNTTWTGETELFDEVAWTDKVARVGRVPWIDENVKTSNVDIIRVMNVASYHSCPCDLWNDIMRCGIFKQHICTAAGLQGAISC